MAQCLGSSRGYQGRQRGVRSRRLARHWPASPSLPPSLLPGPSTLPHAGTPDYKTVLSKVDVASGQLHLCVPDNDLCRACFSAGQLLLLLQRSQVSVPTLTIQHSTGNRQGSWQCGRGHADSWSHEPRGQEGKSGWLHPHVSEQSNLQSGSCAVCNIRLGWSRAQQQQTPTFLAQTLLSVLSKTLQHVMAISGTRTSSGWSARFSEQCVL